MKQCASCEQTKDILEFYTIKDEDDRYQPSCKVCRKNGKDAYREHWEVDDGSK